jgi:hypothetical protein
VPVATCPDGDALVGIAGADEEAWWTKKLSPS